MRLRSVLAACGIGARRLKIHSFGLHRNHMPPAHAPYRPLFAKHIEFVTQPDEADVLVVGRDRDLKNNAAHIAQLCERNPSLRAVVLSEEPLWDTLRGSNFPKSHAAVKVDSASFNYAILNHATCSIYEFEKIPYCVTLSDDFFARYSALFRRNAGFTAQYLLEHWQNAPWRAAFYAAKRLETAFDVKYPKKGVLGLSSYRNQVAEQLEGDRILRVGRGWSGDTRRQDLPDWHLDKLTALDRRAFIVSGLENTHQRSYVSEKIFDAFAFLGVPLYFASPAHRVHDVVSDAAYLNVFGLSATEAAARVGCFSPDIEFAEAYLEAQSRLCELFSTPEILVHERKRVVSEVVRALTDICGK
jgi:hypothetical protein